MVHRLTAHDAEGRQIFQSALLHPLGRLTLQNLNQKPLSDRPATLIESKNARDNLLCVHSRVLPRPVRAAVAAAATVGRRRLAEIVQHSLPQAVGGLAVPAHLAQAIKITLQGGLTCLLVQIIGQIPAVFDQKPAQAHVRLAGIQNTVGHLPITSRASGLLIVAFQILRHVVMDDIGHVGLVDAHAKGVGRHHDALAVIEKIFLRSLTGLGIQSGVIACRSKTSTVQDAVHVIN